MNKFWNQLAILLFALAPLYAKAGGDEVVVVYNPNMPESKAVADYYAKARHVPENQIYGFPTTTNEVMSRDAFQRELQMPLARRLETDGLWRFGSITNAATNGRPAHVVRGVVASKIRYAVLCYGVPLKIAPDPDLREPVESGQPSAFRRNEAAVDSELAWLPMIEAHLPLSGPLRNWAYGATNADWLTPTNGILLVARLDGPTPAIARGLVDKALEAERDGLWGRAYFDARGLGKTNAYYPGDRWILGAAQVCRVTGFETTVDDKPATFPASFPMSHIAIYAGWYAGGACGPFALPKVEFMPGAFAYHLHSDSADTLRSATQDWCGPLLAKGATCTMGCVYEPYLSATPNVALFLARFIASQFTFGQASWAAQPVLSWQITVIGDPLYRPFGTPPEVLHRELARRHSPLIQWSFLRLLNLDLAHGAPPARLIKLIQTIGIATNSPVLTEKLGNLFAAENQPASAVHAYQQALKLNPSPEQRIRLRLELGEKLAAEKKNILAIADYQELLKEAPDYPGKVAIKEKVSALQQKLAKFDPLDKP